MKNKIIEFFSFILIFLTLILVFVSSIRITYLKINLLDYSYYLMFVGVLGLIIYIISKIKNFKFSKYEIMFFILIVFSILSLINAINIEDALYGRINRREGLFTILTYYILSLIGMNIKNKNYLKIIISLIIFIGLSNLVYGLEQVDILELFLVMNDDYQYATGFTGWHMYYGSLMSLCFPMIVGICVKTKKNNIKIISFIFVILFSIGVIISHTMSIYLSMFFILLLVLFDYIRKIKNKEIKFNKKYIFVSLIFILSFTIFIFNYKDKTIIEDVKTFINETTSILKGDINDNFGTGRIYIWKNTIKKIKENPFGVGIDNFYNAFNPPLIDRNTNTYVAKAHNDYLQRMLCEGIISGIFFIFFILYIFFKNLFKEKNSIYYGLYLAFTSYSIQAFFNISVTRVAPIYFIILGLLIVNEYDKKNL